jgi:alkylation response protein AidB-like acyl-CoA dehydrogenase
VDFDDSPAEAEFRAESRAWLDAHATRRSDGHAEVWRMYRPRSLEEDLRGIETAKAWQLKKAEAGFAGITWPVEFGGRALSPHLAAVFKQEEALYDVPANAFQVGVDMVGPTIIAHGNDAQRRRYLDPTRRGDHTWCQLFSEPGAGSDLAGVTTKAERDGDEFVVNGQKVWTTAAHTSDWAILLARTDFDVPKHRGITTLLVDMTSDGVDARPLRQIDGAVHFNEVFLTDVRVPAENVLGTLGGGWAVAATTLMAERSAIGGGGMVQWPEILMLAESAGATSNPVIRQRLARLHGWFQITRFLGYRVQTSLSRGEIPGPESSVLKLHISRVYEEVGSLVEAIMGADGMLYRDDAPFGGFFNDLFLAQWAPRIGGGTDQIQRNIVGERVLGLPAEARPDRNLAFRETLGAARSRNGDSG